MSFSIFRWPFFHCRMIRWKPFVTRWWRRRSATTTSTMAISNAEARSPNPITIPVSWSNATRTPRWIATPSSIPPKLVCSRKYVSVSSDSDYRFYGNFHFFIWFILITVSQLIDWLIDWLMVSITWLIDWSFLSNLLVHWSNDWLIDWFSEFPSVRRRDCLRY